MTKCTMPSASFPRCRGRQIIARFDGGDVTSDGGILLLRQLDREMGLTLRPPHESYGDRPFGFLSHQPEEPVHSARWIAGQNGFAAKPPQREATP